MHTSPACIRQRYIPFILVVFAFLLNTLPASATDLDSLMARQYANAFFRQVEWVAPGEELSTSLVYAPQFTDAANHYTDIAFYVFQLEEKGYVGISAWNTTRTLLFYAEGDFEVNREVPAFQYWLSYYTELALQRYLDKAPDEKSDIVTSKAGEITYFTTPDFVDPMLTTTWDQDCFYNELCPVDAEGPCGHVWVGCVATAIAQIMNYHEYPAVGTGSHSYTHDIYGVLSADFTGGYDYSLFPDNLTEQNLEVARFLYHIGVAFEMDYSPDGSGARFEMDALTNFFNYDDAISYRSRSYYEDEVWMVMLMVELANNRPVYYRGSNESGGHAFVCDGYDTFGLFHFNLGWGGVSDGYYALDDLAFNQEQAAGFYFSPPFTGPVNENDSLALVELYVATGGSSWTNSDNWLTGPVDTWYGVDAYNGRVISIDLSVNNLVDSLPDELWTLEFLGDLNLSGNSLTGTISDSISKLKALEELNLNDNSLSGLLPEGLGDLPLLSYLNLGSNSLSGEIPDTLGTLNALGYLNLGYNSLSGEIPSVLGELEYLYNLNLMHNSLEGPIPDSLYNATALGVLCLNNNQLTGTISPRIDSLSGLSHLYLDNNQFTGELPDSLFGHTGIRYLLLDNNSFTGTIPDEIGDLNLSSLNLSHNQFSGAVPATLQNCTNLFYCGVADNEFDDFPDLSGLPELTNLYMYQNRFTFEDIEPNIGIPTISYFGQANVGDTTLRIVGEGSPDTLKVSCGGANNLYQWYWDGIPISGATDSTYIIAGVLPADAGEYHCVVSNSLVTGLDISSNPITLKVMPEGWSYDPNDFALDGWITATVSVAGEDRTTGYLASFLDTLCTGMVKPEYSTTAGRELFFLECHGINTSGDSLTFQFYDTIAGETYLLNEKLEFASGSTEGTELSPIVFNHGWVIECDMPVGWSWISVNVEMADMSVNSVLPSNSAHGDYMKDQWKSTMYYNGYGWFGTMNELHTGYLYKSRFASSNTLSLCGIPVDPESTPINLNAGWNYLGFLPLEPIPLDEALATLVLAEGDYIKNQTESATYYDGLGWIGSLTEMNPLDGYMIWIAQAGALYYPASAGGKKGVLERQVEDELPFDYRQYSTNSSLTAMVMVGDEDKVSQGDRLIAMVGNDIRGIADAAYYQGMDRMAFPIMVFGDETEEQPVRFRYYESSRGITHDCNETWDYQPDAVIGNAREPFVLKAASLFQDDQQMPDPGLRVYPNPARDELHISMEIIDPGEVMIRMLDLSGRVAALISYGQFVEDAFQATINTSKFTSGTYIIEVSVDGNVRRNRVVVSR